MSVKITNEIKALLHGGKLLNSASAKFYQSVFDTDVSANNENQKKIKGSVLLTDTRIILYSKTTFGGYYLKEFKINSVNKTMFRKYLFEYLVIFYTNDNFVKINIPNKNAAKKINETLEECISKWKTNDQNILNLIKYQIDVDKPLIIGVEKPIKITINNPSETAILNINIQSDISTLVKCDKPTAQIKTVLPNSSEYTAIFITPRIADKIDLGNLNISYEINGNTYEKETIAIGTYEAVEKASHKPAIYSNDINSDLSISRETEFYQGYIRFKMSVTNTSSFVVNDVALDFDYDHNLLRIDRREPDYQIKNGRTIFGNISGNSSKTIAVYFDPMMCSKGADINCQVNYKDAKGQPQTTHMKPKQISVVCPIMETESDINIGRLKEFIEKLPHSDSKVYQVQNDFDIDVLKNISREIVQKHDVKHIRTLFTKDGNTCEIWYYGKTKVHGHDIVIKITILSETQSIELFAATESVESLAGLLAEVGRELKSAIESKVTGNVQQVINVSIKDSIIQRSNLLSYCDIDGNCSGDVVIEDSLVQRSSVGLDAEVKDSVVQRTDIGGEFCTACGGVVPDGAKFCMECGGKIE